MDMMRIDTTSRLKQHDMILFRQLRHEIHVAGCTKPAPAAIGLHMMITLAIYFAAFALLLTGPDWEVRLLLLVAIAFASVQAGYIAHEAGHLSFSRNAALSRFLGHFFLTFISGYGHSIYKEKHNAHHAHINVEDRDPDISGGGLFTFHKGAAKSKRGIARWFTAHQRFLVWFMYGFIPLASKRDSLVRYFASGRGSTRTGQIMLAMHFVMWLGLPSLTLSIVDTLINFALASWLMGPYLGCVILLNHSGTIHLPSDNSLSPFRRALLTTRNFESGTFCTYLSGGTNSHLEHHLFPTVPIFRLRQAREITRQFCKTHRLPYRETNWWTAQQETLAYLEKMSRYAKSVWRTQLSGAT
jgi:fatty acid desaturase